MARFQESEVVLSDYSAHEFYKVLCEGIATYTKSTYLFNFDFIIQRIVIAFVLIVLRGFPLFQLGSLMFVSIYRIKNVVKYSPFIEGKDNAVELFNEFTILFVISLIHSMLIAHMS